MVFGRSKTDRFSEVDVHELADAIERGGELVDVREKDEFRSGHVPGARLLPLSQVADQAGRFRGRGPVYVICASGGRSKRAASLLRSAGVDAHNVRGGTSAWARAGKRLERGA